MEVNQLSTDKRAELLQGYSLNARAAGKAPNWGDVSSAPSWVQSRCLEVRLAASEKRSISPVAERQYQREAETRSLTSIAKGAVKKIVAPFFNKVDADNRRKLAAIERQMVTDPAANALIKDFENRQKLERIAEQIERDNNED